MQDNNILNVLHEDLIFEIIKYLSDIIVHKRTSKLFDFYVTKYINNNGICLIINYYDMLDYISNNNYFVTIDVDTYYNGSEITKQEYEFRKYSRGSKRTMMFSPYRGEKNR
jgi:hypothetical protein